MQIILTRFTLDQSASPQSLVGTTLWLIQKTKRQPSQSSTAIWRARVPLSSRQRPAARSLTHVAARRSASRRFNRSATAAPNKRRALRSLSQSCRTDLLANAISKAVTVSGTHEASKCGVTPLTRNCTGTISDPKRRPETGQNACGHIEWKY